MKKSVEVFACYNTNKEVRLSSSSGAVFSLLADYILEQQGIIYGVSMSEDCYSAHFISVSDKKDLEKLRGSKYLQAKIGNTFQLVKDNLSSGRIVLFSGTGCQVNGLKLFLGKEYDNLICVDVICHGVPSPALWREYVKYQEQKNGGKLKAINFRCKDISWTDFGMNEVLSEIPQSNEKKVYISKDKDAYMQMFLRDYCLRPSCYECVAKKSKMSDLTIADFWGINDVAADMNDGMGTSLAIIRTEKGKDIFEKISKCMKLKEVSYEDGVRCNPAEFKSCYRPSQRDTFFNDMHKLSFDELEKKYVSTPIKLSFKSTVKIKMKNIIKELSKIRGGAAERNEIIMDYALCFAFDVSEDTEYNERETGLV